MLAGVVAGVGVGVFTRGLSVIMAVEWSDGTAAHCLKTRTSAFNHRRC